MTCRELVAFLMEYLDGALSDPVRRLFEEHLAECPDCVAYLDSYRAAIRLGQDACRDAAVAPPDDLVRAVLAARAAQTSHTPRSATSMATVHEPAAVQALQCMEIWGGSHAADAAVSTPGLDLWVHSRPHAQADGGGDVHYVSLCGGGVITRFILADISGHGASVAELARSLRDLMRRNINRKSQARLVRALNEQFAELARLRRFATAIVATYLTTGDTLTICNAGHPRPLWYRAARGEWSVLGKDQDSPGLTNLPLGIDDATVYEQTELVLGTGDLVLFYTDALTEAADPAGNLLGEDGLHALVGSLDPRDPAAWVRGLVERLDGYRGGRPSGDDLTFLLLRHNASSPGRLTLGQTLDVYAKVLGLRSV